MREHNHHRQVASLTEAFGAAHVRLAAVYSSVADVLAGRPVASVGVPRVAARPEKLVATRGEGARGVDFVCVRLPVCCLPVNNQMPMRPLWVDGRGGK